MINKKVLLKEFEEKKAKIDKLFEKYNKINSENNKEVWYWEISKEDILWLLNNKRFQYITPFEIKEEKNCAVLREIAAYCKIGYNNRNINTDIKAVSSEIEVALFGETYVGNEYMNKRALFYAVMSMFVAISIFNKKKIDVVFETDGSLKGVFTTEIKFVNLSDLQTIKAKEEVLLRGLKIFNDRMVSGSKYSCGHHIHIDYNNFENVAHFVRFVKTLNIIGENGFYKVFRRQSSYYCEFNKQSYLTLTTKDILKNDKKEMFKDKVKKTYTHRCFISTRDNTIEIRAFNGTSNYKVSNYYFDLIKFLLKNTIKKCLTFKEVEIFVNRYYEKHDISIV